MRHEERDEKDVKYLREIVYCVRAVKTSFRNLGEDDAELPEFHYFVDMKGERLAPLRRQISTRENTEFSVNLHRCVLYATG